MDSWRLVLGGNSLHSLIVSKSARLRLHIRSAGDISADMSASLELSTKRFLQGTSGTGAPLRPRMLVGPELLHDERDDHKCEWLVKVEWIKHVSADDGRWRRKAGLIAYQNIVALLSGQLKTLQFLEQQFSVNFERLLSRK